jgi:hypothetical protein
MAGLLAHLSSDLISGWKKQQAGLEPYRQYNYSLSIVGLSGSDTLELSVQTGSAPNPTIDEIELPHGNDSIFVTGKAHVESISFTFLDMVEPHTAKVLADWWKLHYNPETSQMFPATNYKRVGMLFQTFIDASQAKAWELQGLWMPSFSPAPSLDYGTSDAVRIEATFRFDRAIPRIRF